MGLCHRHLENYERAIHDFKRALHFLKGASAQEVAEELTKTEVLMMQKIRCEILTLAEHGSKPIDLIEKFVVLASKSKSHRSVLLELIEDLSGLGLESSADILISIGNLSKASAEIIGTVLHALTEQRFDHTAQKVGDFLTNIDYDFEIVKGCLLRYLSSRDPTAMGAGLNALNLILAKQQPFQTRDLLDPLMDCVPNLRSHSDFIMGCSLWEKVMKDVSKEDKEQAVLSWLRQSPEDHQIAVMRLLSTTDRALVMSVLGNSCLGGVERLYSRAESSEDLLEILSNITDLEAVRAQLVLETHPPLFVKSSDSFKVKALKLQLALKLEQKPLPSLDFLTSSLDSEELVDKLEDTLIYLSIEQPAAFEDEGLLKYALSVCKSVFSVVCIALNLVINENTRLFFNNEHGLTEEDTAKVREFMHSTQSFTSRPLKFRSQSDSEKVLQLLCKEAILSELLSRVQSLKSAESTPSLQQKLSLLLFIVAEQKQVRPVLVSRGCLQLLCSFDKAEAVVRGQAIARILISTNPGHLSVHLCTNLVTPIVNAIAESKHELTDFECAMSLTNLSSSHAEVRDMIVAKKGWRLCFDLIFGENEALRLEGLNLACNLTSSSLLYREESREEVVKDLKVMAALLVNGSYDTQIAACSALANLSFDQHYCQHIKDQPQLLEFLKSEKQGELARRAEVLQRNCLV
mmetsp:Transcript_1748/g.3720  ORF Transcript_1748/g.3720 Transcript_1748/m.3720 type:complete len:689 (+) Transcript_1748:2229-4295(+)